MSSDSPGTSTSPLRVLLTGGGGMVGRNFLEAVQARPELKLSVDAPRSRELNLLDADATRRAVSAGNYDVVIHCAGTVGGIQANMREPVRFLVENWTMGQNLVLAARDAGVKRLINLGSSCMYPRNQEEPLREEQVLTGELEPTNEGYAIAKCAVARLCRYIAQEDPSVQYKTLIPCNLYGRWDHFDPKSSHLVASIIHKMHLATTRGDASVEIWGDGTVRREFMYCADLADAMLRAITHYASLPELMNVGLGHDYSVNEYYQACASIMGYSGSFRHDTSKPVGMKRKLVATTLAEQWGWQASTSLEAGLKQTIEHYLTEHAGSQS